MPISSLRIVLDKRLASSALAVLKSRPGIEIGERVGTDVPIVIDVPTSAEAREMWEWVRSRPGVVQADVVFVEIAPDESVGAQGGVQ